MVLLEMISPHSSPCFQSAGDSLCRGIDDSVLSACMALSESTSAASDSPSSPSDHGSDTSLSPGETQIIGQENRTEGEVCSGCSLGITDQYLLKVSERAWHVSCLRCTVCQTSLDRHTSCFIRDGNVYCKVDYSRHFGTKCSKCLRTIQSTDWVRRAKNNVYHLACFSCDSCKRQLSTGEEFALQDSRVLCKTHYIELIEGGSQTDEFGDFSADESGNQKQKTKRVRTTFTEEQLQVLQANFQLDSNPDGQDLERIAQITGLSKRVTQVWFQNSRARQKKHQQTQQSRMSSMNNMNNMNNLNASLTGSLSISTTGSMSSPSPSESMYHHTMILSPLKSVYIET